MQKPKVILTDIEGTTTSISFVTDTLFPYFLEHIEDIIQFLDRPEVIHAFERTIQLAEEEDGELISSNEEILNKLRAWCKEDRKITPLKTVQGFIWDIGYKNGSLKGHVYPDVPPALKKWVEEDILLAVFSSGSVAAQKLIYGFSDFGDLTSYFSAYFDTNTGSKRDAETYSKIATELKVEPQDVLFLSDIVEELYAAEDAGLQTIQLIRNNQKSDWPDQVTAFSEIHFE